MLSKEVVENTIEAALSTGGDFAEIFAENTSKNSISMVNGKVDKVLSGIDYGVGIRIFDGTNAVYVYTNDTSKKSLIETAKKGAQAVKNEKQPIKIFNFDKQEISNKNKIKVYPSQVAKKDIVEILKTASNEALEYNNLIKQTSTGCADIVQNVFIANSNGLWVQDERVRTRFSFEAIASNESEKQSGRFSPGGQIGYELFEKFNVKEIAKESARIAVTMLNAKPCPSDKMTVVIDNGFGGVIFHEACGHSLEATAVAKGASVFCNKLGEKIASEVVTAIDDGTIENGWGSGNIDDEGTPTQRNILIENGILKSYLIDTLNGMKMGMKSTGSSRRESYRYAPTSRMSNTFIAAGKSTPEEIISQTEYGLYAKQMGGGSVIQLQECLTLLFLRDILLEMVIYVNLLEVQL